MQLSVGVGLIMFCRVVIADESACHRPSDQPPAWWMEVRAPQKILCEPLEIGKTEDIAWQNYKSPTGIQSKYELSRISENAYGVTLNLKFIKYPDNDASEQSKINTDYHSKVNDCLKEVNPYLKGPSGESLVIQLKPPEKCTRPDHLIEIGENGIRSHSEKYEANIDCTTIAHELLHLLGLVDEYPEKILGYTVDPQTGARVLGNNVTSKNAYDCRAMGVENSIMRDHRMAFMAVQPKQIWEAKFCTCNAPDFECSHFIATELQNFYRKNKLTECPTKFKIQKDRYETVGAELVGIPTTRPLLSFGLGQGQVYKIGTAPPARDSLLYPAQFRSIIYPGCQEKNSIYYSCAANAYLTSIPNDGTGCTISRDKSCIKGGEEWLK